MTVFGSCKWRLSCFNISKGQGWSCRTPHRQRQQMRTKTAPWLILLARGTKLQMRRPWSKIQPCWLSLQRPRLPAPSAPRATLTRVGVTRLFWHLCFVTLLPPQANFCILHFRYWDSARGPSEPGSSSKATASAAQSSQVQGEEAASASSTRKPSSTPEKDKQKDSDTVATGNPLQTPAKDSRKATKRKPQAESDTPEDKKKKKKKVPPPGCGGAHPKAQGCKICARPRDAFQRGTACATCQTLMRKKKCRSIPTVLADPAKRDEIRAESLALKPVALDDVQEQRERVAKIEKHLAELKQLLGKGS